MSPAFRYLLQEVRRSSQLSFVLAKQTDLSSRSHCFSTAAKEAEKVDETKIVKSVFISQSNDIFTNLALEDWLYRNFNFKQHHVMMLWQNDPCVVIGRHQNPWQEANMGSLAEQNILLARRNSGGGAVFHDSGNLNMTFFTPRECYSRKANLKIISSALKRAFSIETKINEREDIVFDDNLKISGTASKLGRPNAYHHCTLLVNVNTSQLSDSLHKYEKGIQSNATESKPAPVLNLQNVCNEINVKNLIETVGYEYLRTLSLSGQDAGQDLISKQRGFQLINPTEEWFPGLDKIRAEFESWTWRFGRTPKFQVSRSFEVPYDLTKSNEKEELSISLVVEGGFIEDVILKIPPSLVAVDGFLKNAEMLTSLRGHMFTEDALDKLHVALVNQGQPFVADCVRHTMSSV